MKEAERDQIVVQCVGCKSKRVITLKQAAKGQPFCSLCGNKEVEIKAKGPGKNGVVINGDKHPK